MRLERQAYVSVIARRHARLDPGRSNLGDVYFRGWLSGTESSGIKSSPLAARSSCRWVDAEDWSITLSSSSFLIHNTSISINHVEILGGVRVADSHDHSAPGGRVEARQEAKGDRQ